MAVSQRHVECLYALTPLLSGSILSCGWTRLKVIAQAFDALLSVRILGDCTPMAAKQAPSKAF
jgi:hypothetical protein